MMNLSTGVGRSGYSRIEERCRVVPFASKSSQGVRKLGRVLREKAAVDFERIFKGTSKSREQLGVVDELAAYWTLESSEDTLQEMEDVLIMADFGPDVALRLTDSIREEIRGGRIKSGDQILGALRTAVLGLISSAMDRHGDPVVEAAERPCVWMIVGVNGGGKTTTVGKLARRFRQSGRRVLLGPGDTFRAAAFEQLSKWCERSGSVMGSWKEGQTPSEVLAASISQGTQFRSCARSSGLRVAEKEGDIDVVICDTSGRLHTDYGLLEELAECKQALSKTKTGAPDEVLLVLDGTTGLNMLNQAREFNEMVGLTGLILTKLDGTSKGGAIVSVMEELGLPVRFIGVGEKIDDLQPFDPASFVEALLPSKSEDPPLAT